MKLIPIFFLSLFIFCFDGIGQVIIEGKIHNYDGKSTLFYYPTLEGIHTSVWVTIVPMQRENLK